MREARTVGAGNDLHELLREPENWIDRFSEQLANWGGPVVVKETRQAIKSRQFFYTFLLLLIAMVVWSFLGVSRSYVAGQDEAGAELLSGYSFILGFPLLIIIPFTAFRSLIREFEEDTLQLVSITTMSARRIVYGKLASALLQMLVYLAAIVPGIAFSYLLRGVDLYHIVSNLAILVSSSIGLTGLGLMMGSVGRQFFLRVVTHLFLLGVLAIAYFLTCGFIAEVMRFGPALFPGQVLYSLVTVFLAIGVLCLETSISGISFFADNRSTRVRLALLLVTVTGVSAAFLSTPFLSDNGNFDNLYSLLIYSVIAHGWTFFGSLMVAEYPVISARVRRDIPQSFWGQSFWGLLLPGPGRGYLLALAMIWGWLGGFVLLAPVCQALLGRNALRVTILGLSDWQLIYSLGLTNAWFASAHLSLTYLFARFLGTRLPRPAPVIGMAFSISVYVLLTVVALVLDVLVKVFSGQGVQNDDWTLRVTNFFSWPWMLSFFPSQIDTIEFVFFHIIVACVSLSLISVCLMMAGREIALPQALIPERVRAELQARRVRAMHRDEESIEELFRNPG